MFDPRSVTGADRGVGSRNHLRPALRPLRMWRVELTYWGYDGGVHVGHIVVHAWVVGAVVDDFGDDDSSMAANNTSGFNCRTVSGSSSLSEHVSGLAIDLNPIQNPYVRRGRVDPPAGRSWLDREFDTPGMVRAGDVVVRTFAAAGFRWGGSWSGGRDYQHFSTSGR